MKNNSDLFAKGALVKDGGRSRMMWKLLRMSRIDGYFAAGGANAMSQPVVEAEDATLIDERVKRLLRKKATADILQASDKTSYFFLLFLVENQCLQKARSHSGRRRQRSTPWPST